MAANAAEHVRVFSFDPGVRIAGWVVYNASTHKLEQFNSDEIIPQPKKINEDNMCAAMWAWLMARKEILLGCTVLVVERQWRKNKNGNLCAEFANIVLFYWKLHKPDGRWFRAHPRTISIHFKLTKKGKRKRADKKQRAVEIFHDRFPHLMEVDLMRRDDPADAYLNAMYFVEKGLLSK